MFFPGSDEFLKSVITDLSFMQSLRVTGELVQRIDCAVPLLSNLLASSLEGFGHVSEVARSIAQSCWIFAIQSLVVGKYRGILEIESTCLRNAVRSHAVRLFFS